MARKKKQRYPDVMVLLCLQDMGVHKVARFLKTPLHRVVGVAQKYNFRRARMAVVKGDVVAFIQDLQAGGSHINALAEKHGVPIEIASKIAHLVLGAKRFRRGRSKPLSVKRRQRAISKIPSTGIPQSGGGPSR